jgi:hypothetical protein
LTGPTGAPLHDDGSRGLAATVFVSDPTAEAERVARALRGAGYVVVDVPQSMLVARVAVQHPRVVLIDADSEGALDVVSRMRELPDADDIHVLFVARPGGAIPSPDEALAHEGSGLFVRPVDVPALVRKVDALTGGPQSDDAGKGSTPPPSPTKRRSSSPPSLPPASIRSAGVGAIPPEPRAPGVPARGVGARPSKVPSEPPTAASPGSSGRKVIGLAPPVSPELQQLLVEAEQRVHVQADHDSLVPSPEDEIEAVLPAELLAALDEPLEEDDDDDEVVIPAARGSGPPPIGRERTRDGARMSGASTTGTGGVTGNTPRPTSAQRTGDGESTLTPNPAQTHGGTHSGPTGDGSATTGNSEPRERSLAASPGPPPVTSAAGATSVPPPTTWSPEPSSPGAASSEEALPARNADPLAFPAVLGPGDALRVVARAIASRTTGSLCVAAPEAERRIILREGDVVTTASTAEDDSLLAFLGVRGDLPRETVRRLGAKFPPFGRHAGAALVARGYLRQDQMWPTLRAHAEWLLARALQTNNARLMAEAQPPGRLAGEPSVFGGSTGAEVFVEIVRRIVPPADAVERLGGLGSRVGDGPEARLLGECALAPAEIDQVHGAVGRALGDVLEGAPDGDLATVLFALAQLGVVEVLSAIGDGALAPDEANVADVAALDAEAIRERVRARMQLVDDADYFALLGVTRNATGYEVRRAFLELRRAFDPARVLTPEVADLADDVRKITVVLEEAYEILKDAARRERYRRAIEAAPGR